MPNIFQRAFSYFSSSKTEAIPTGYRLGTNSLSLDTILGNRQIGGKVNVNPESVLGLSAVLNCHANLARDISTLPMKVYKSTEKGNKAISEHPIYNLLHTQPNGFMTPQSWRQLQVWRMCKYGNSFNIIERSEGDYRPIAIWPINEFDIKKIIISDGNRLIYITTYGNYYGDDILHFKLLSDDGIIGKSYLTYQMDLMGLGLSSQRYGLEFYEKGAHYDVVITHPSKLSDAAKTSLKKGVDETRATEYTDGVIKKTVVLEEGMKIERLSYSPAEAEFVLTQKYTAKKIAGLYRMPLSFIGDLEDSNNSIDENTSLNYVKYGLMPWIVAIEQEINMKLFRENEKKKYFAKINVNALLRGDTATRFESYAKMLDRGVYSINQVCEWEDMEHVDGGDQRFVQANNVMPLNSMQDFANVTIDKKKQIKAKSNG